MLSGCPYINPLGGQLLQTRTTKSKEINSKEPKKGLYREWWRRQTAKSQNPSREIRFVSKPLMEKKRRARINQCLDQLKSLLESYYSSSIRKRKLEKADILELTVKHLRNLQKIQKCTDYHRGFRSCLANVNQYLLMADNLNGSDRWMLSQLSGNLSSSTMDSGPGQAETQEEARMLRTPTPASEEVKTAKCKTHGADMSNVLPSGDGKLCSGPKQAQKTHEKTSGLKFQSSVHSRNETVNSQNTVWRPW
uniref:Hairy-related 3 n=1 Tax=Sphaeramia orbicularis TaxID=375764 RepID=A0A672YN90_9TELE